MTGTDSSNAKQSILKLDGVLTRSHLIIGGIAVSFYHPTRISKDIDIICEHAEISNAIERLFPSNEYSSVDHNQDDLRPSYVIQSRTDNEKIYFIGPKIEERDPYKYINWRFIQRDSVPFSYQGEACRNIVVPNLEKLTFLKLISMLNRLESKPTKGQQDLLDFVNLSNNPQFRINYFYDVLRQTNCVKYVVDRLSTLRGKADLTPLEKSTLFDVVQVLFSDPEVRDERVYDRVYGLSEAKEFYERVAYQYDQRNTELRYKAHQKTVGAIRERVEGRDREFTVVDLGCGTGKIIASSFVHSRNLRWIGVDYSDGMLAQFRQNMDESAIKFSTVRADIQAAIPQAEISSADFVLLCFVLTTTLSKSIVSDVMRAISTGSSLIISDIHPSYTTTRPYYDFAIPKGEYVALRPQPIYPDIIEKLAAENDFVRKSYDIIYNRDGVPYSFFLELTKS